MINVAIKMLSKAKATIIGSLYHVTVFLLEKVDENLERH